MHNSLETISACLESVRAQTHSPRRVIVVDDASTDASADFVADRFPGIELVRLPSNLGVGGARNAGVARASADFVAFLDSDDSWRPMFLERVLGALALHDGDFGSSSGMRTGGRAKGGRLVGAPGTSDATADFWRYAMQFMPTHTSSTVVRRSLFGVAGGFNEKLRFGEDVPCWARLWLDGRFVFVNDTLWDSTILETGMMKGPRRHRYVVLVIGDLGSTLLRAIGRRRPGTGWFVIWYARMVVRRHLTWLRLRA